MKVTIIFSLAILFTEPNPGERNQSTDKETDAGLYFPVCRQSSLPYRENFRSQTALERLGGIKIAEEEVVFR
jgi:hypothetical protein